MTKAIHPLLINGVKNNFLCELLAQTQFLASTTLYASLNNGVFPPQI